MPFLNKRGFPTRNLLQAKDFLPGSPLARDLVAAWIAQPLLFSSFLWVDASGRSNHGTLSGMGANSNASGWRGSDRPGGRSELRFSASTSSVVNCGKPQLAGLNQITVAAWVKPITGIGTNAGIFHEWDGTQGSIMFLNGSGTGLVWQVGNSSQRLTISNVLTLNAWNHIAGVWIKGLTKEFYGYVNGKLVGTLSGTAGNNAANTTVAQIGSNTGGLSFFNGAMDAVMLWGRGLSAPEVEILYRESVAGGAHTYRPTSIFFQGIQTTTILTTPSKALYKTDTANIMAGNAINGTPSRALWRIPTPIVNVENLIITTPSRALWRTPTSTATLTQFIITTPSRSLYRTPAASLASMVSATPARGVFQSPAPTMSRTVIATPSRALWQTVQPSVLISNRIITEIPSRSLYRTPTQNVSFGVRTTPSRARYRTLLASVSRKMTPAPSRSLYRAPTASLAYMVLATPSRALYRIPTPAMTPTVITTPSRALWNTVPSSVLISNRIITEVPSRSLYRAPTHNVSLIVLVTPSRALSLTPTASLTYTVIATPSRALYRTPASSLAYTLQALPTIGVWQTSTPRVAIDIALRDCGPVYDAALARRFIFGDWLIRAPSIGLKLSFNFNPDGTWEHRIFGISPIEISAPPGGGLASVANVTVSILEDMLSQSLIQLWETTPNIEGAQVTIDFLLNGETTALRIFTGRIDQITVRDNISEMLCVDDSIHRNLLLPQVLVTTTDFPNADTRALTQPEPLIYGLGSHINAAPLLYVDTEHNAYLVAGHPLLLGGKLAIFDGPTSTFLPLNSIIPLNDPISALLTLGTLDTGIMQVREQGNVTAASNAVDGNSQSLTRIGTGLPNSNLNGIGYVGYTTGQVGYPLTTITQVTLTKHRRSPGSDPTTNALFTIRTLDPNTGAVIRTLATAGPYNHTTSAQTDIITISDTTIALNELLEVFLLASHTGGLGTANQTYEIGEISITPVQVFSANASNLITAVAVPITVQDLRFNPTSYTLAIQVASSVTNALRAIDGLSTPPARIGTTGIDSNLDGIGELVVAASSPSASQRANNVVIVDFVNHRRSPGSSPTVTGKFSLQALNQTTGVVVRDNLFVTEAFRHTTNPQTTSYVVTGVNFGRVAQMAVRLVARNEGGAGAANERYEVGEIVINSYYQPSGDSNELFLYQGSWSGRRDPDGTVTSYAHTAAGTLLTQPDQVIASILLQELSASIDVNSFATAYTFYGRNAYIFDGAIGAGWAVQRLLGRVLLDELARQGKAVLAPTFDGTLGLRVYGNDSATHQSFDIDTILCTDGSERTAPHERNSTFEITLGDLSRVANRFEIHYSYNAGSQKYDGLVFVDGADNGSTNSSDATIVGPCVDSVQRYGKLEPMVIEAYWIANTSTAEQLLLHLVNYFSAQRLRIQFETTLKALCLQVGDNIAVTYPMLPTADNGRLFEVHVIRYLPTRGRIQLIASRLSTIETVITAPPTRMILGFAQQAAAQSAGGIFRPGYTGPFVFASVQIFTPSKALWETPAPSVTNGVATSEWFFGDSITGLYSYGFTEFSYDVSVYNGTSAILYKKSTLSETWSTLTTIATRRGGGTLIPWNSVLYWAVARSADTDAEVYTSADGTNFSLDHTFTGKHNFACSAVFNGKLYMGSTTIPSAFLADGSVAIWSRNSLGVWTEALAFSGNERSVSALKVFNGTLYAAVSKIPNRFSEHAIDIYSTADGTTWTLVFSTNDDSNEAGGLEVFSGKLYLSTATDVETASPNNRKIWRTDDGSTWNIVFTLPTSPDGGRLTQFATDGTRLMVGAGVDFLEIGDNENVGNPQAEVYTSTNGTDWSLSVNFTTDFSDSNRTVVALNYNATLARFYAITGDFSENTTTLNIYWFGTP